MDTKETKKEELNTAHTCPPGHCCNCNGCGGMWSHTMMHGDMGRYWRRHFIILVLGVIAAFFVGMKLGEIKGYLMSGSGATPFYHRGWMMEDRGGNGYYGYPNTLTTPTPPTTSPSPQPLQ